MTTLIILFNLWCFLKNSYHTKPVSIIIDKIDRNIKKYDKTKYWYLIMLKSNILSVYSPNMTIIVDSDDLTLGKTLNTQNLLILIRCFLIKIIIVIVIKCF